MAYRNYLYCKNRRRSWRCVHFTQGKCKAHLLYFNDNYVQVIGIHSHKDDSGRIEQGRKAIRALQHQYQAQQTHQHF